MKFNHNIPLYCILLKQHDKYQQVDVCVSTVRLNSWCFLEQKCFSTVCVNNNIFIDLLQRQVDGQKSSWTYSVLIC